MNSIVRVPVGSVLEICLTELKLFFGKDEVEEQVSTKRQSQAGPADEPAIDTFRLDRATFKWDAIGDSKKSRTVARMAEGKTDDDKDVSPEPGPSPGTEAATTTDDRPSASSSIGFHAFQPRDSSDSRRSPAKFGYWTDCKRYSGLNRKLRPILLSLTSSDLIIQLAVTGEMPIIKYGGKILMHKNTFHVEKKWADPYLCVSS